MASKLLRSGIVVLFAASPVWASDLFKKIDLEAACKLANEGNKLVFVDFYADWCGWCKKLDSITFRDAQVIAWLNTHTIPIKIDAQKNAELAAKYGVRGFPTMVFLNADGSVRDRIGGYVDGKGFLTTVNRIAPLDGSAPRLSAEAFTAFQKARTADQQGQWTEALKSYREVLATAPEHSEAMEGCYRILTQELGDIEQVDAWAGDYLNKNKQKPQALAKLARVLMSSDALEHRRPELASKAAEAAHQVCGAEKCPVLDSCARTMYEVGQLSKAIELQKKALSQANDSEREQAGKVLAFYESCAALNRGVPVSSAAPKRGR